MDKVDRIEHPFRVTGASSSTKRRKRTDEDFRDYLEEKKHRGNQGESGEKGGDDSSETHTVSPSHVKESPDTLLASLDIVDIRLRDVHRFNMPANNAAEKTKKETMADTNMEKTDDKSDADTPREKNPKRIDETV